MGRDLLTLSCWVPVLIHKPWQMRGQQGSVLCVRLFAREPLRLGMQGSFLCFHGMFDICLLLCHLQSPLETFESASLYSAGWATKAKWLKLQ